MRNFAIFHAKVRHTIRNVHYLFRTQKINRTTFTFPPFPHTGFLTPLHQKNFENIVAKGELAHIENFLLLLQCFQLYPMLLFSHIDFPYFCLQSRLLQICCMWKSVNRKQFCNPMNVICVVGA